MVVVGRGRRWSLVVVIGRGRRWPLVVVVGRGRGRGPSGTARH